ncbi:hypothetical protein ANACAC_02241 [Anaerostipes caccae L1-92]|uniref:Uncharacterized protein n=1 Tax=Anaerostipes caccae (strain DSM 14662 / CCUG 47493 / JCM 13470 / NCIMB 13811 / L1-92) TaxID=411490 RepID=B0MFZ1_ANACD|nr:hypothetical protein ANACAC_02241 [Anaerostipes caccae L1-92]
MSKKLNEEQAYYNSKFHYVSIKITSESLMLFVVASSKFHYVSIKILLNFKNLQTEIYSKFHYVSIKMMLK